MTSYCIATRRILAIFFLVCFMMLSGVTVTSVWAQPEVRFWRVESFVIPGPAGMNATQAQAIIGNVIDFKTNPTSAPAITFEGQTCPVSVLPRRVIAGAYFSNAYHLSPKVMKIDPMAQITVIETGCRLPGLDRLLLIAPKRLVFMREGVFFFLVPAPGPSAPPPVPGMAYKSFPGIGLTVSYPPSVQALVGGQGPGHGLGLRITVTPLSELQPGDVPFEASRRIALEDRQALSHGKFGTPVPFAVPVSQSVRPLPGGLYAKVFTTLAEFEICSVVFERTAIFYRGDTRVSISLMASPDAIMNQNPTFFTKNPPQCGQELIWNFPQNADIATVFYERMQNRLTGPAAAAWQTAFQTILDSLRMTP